MLPQEVRQRSGAGGAALLAGAVALTSHGTKASTRAAVNLGPEPFSNWTLSFGEDVLAVWLSWLASVHPIATMILVVLLLVLCVFLIYHLFRFARRAVERMFERYLRYSASQSRNVLYQNCAFCGLSTQWPSSGKTTSFDGTPWRCSALKNSNDCVYGTR